MNETLSQQELVDEGKSAYLKGDFLTSARAYQAAAQSYAAMGDLLSSA